MKVQRILLLMLVIAELIVLLPAAKAELPTDPGDSAVAVALRTQDGLLYTRPTPAKRFHGYAFDTFGPYPFVAAAVAAGLDQAGRTPPEWRQGAAGYGKRFASEFGMAAVSTRKRSRKTLFTIAANAKGCSRG